MSAHAPSSPAASGTGLSAANGSTDHTPGPSDPQDGRPDSQRRSPAKPIPSISLPGKDKETTTNTTKGHAKSTSSVGQSQVGLDPLSNQIYLRTNSNTDQRNPRPESPVPDSPQSKDANTSPASIDARDRRKGPSLLSRLAMRSFSRKDEDEDEESDSEVGELRTDGTYARALTSVVGDSGGYIPLYKEPTRYIHVRTRNKKTKEFNRLFLAQELGSGNSKSTTAKSIEGARGRAPAIAIGSKILKPGDAIWAAEFSLDGRYLAVAGKDDVVRVYAVISTPEERKMHEEEESRDGAERMERLRAPVFLNDPARELVGHTGDVLALSWSKNNFLLSTSMDKTVRLWHMSRTDCLCTFKHSDIVTSVAFHPTDDRFFLAGCMDGQLRLWSIPDKAVAYVAPTNEFTTAVAFSPDGKTAICGLLSGVCMFFETDGLKSQFQIHVRSSRGRNAKGSKITGIRTAMPDPETDDIKVLISSNDSRVRIYSLKTRMLEVKFKGLENSSSQINARFSDEGTHVISGSEDRRAYIWTIGKPDAEFKDKQPMECFRAHPEVVTTALMAPVKTRELLSASRDPVFDLCNPPPVLLGSPGTDSSGAPKQPEHSPAYLNRSKHHDGSIIITTDRTGTIKVFRQDCAFAKRQQQVWETGSKFSGRVNSIGRSASIVTRTSGGSHAQSRRGSLNMTVQLPSDRIISWRQDMDGRSTPAQSERSLSPSKKRRESSVHLSTATSEARRPPYASNPSLRSSFHAPASPREPPQPPTPSFSLVSASDSEAAEDKTESGFWNFSRWKGIGGLRLPGASPTPLRRSVGPGTGLETKRSTEGRDSGVRLSAEEER